MSLYRSFWNTKRYETFDTGIKIKSYPVPLPVPGNKYIIHGLYVVRLAIIFCVLINAL